MSYRLRFHELALAEWHKLDRSIRDPLKKKLAERLENPRVPASALSGMTPPEQCDDGNLTSGDGCSASCITEILTPK